MARSNAQRKIENTVEVTATELPATQEQKIEQVQDTTVETAAALIQSEAPRTETVTEQFVPAPRRPSTMKVADFIKANKVRLDKVSAPHSTTSDKMRALAADGWETGVIAAYLGKIYQHVRNVLSKPLKRPVQVAQQAVANPPAPPIAA